MSLTDPADLTEAQTSNGSTIASTMQQLSISFGVAAAGLTTVVFVPPRLGSTPLAIIQGIHQALYLLGALTILSTAVFLSLKSGDGDNVSQHKVLHTG